MKSAAKLFKKSFQDMQEAKLNKKYNFKRYLSIPSGFASGLWEPYKENTDELLECEMRRKGRHVLNMYVVLLQTYKGHLFLFKAIKKKRHFNSILCVIRAN